MKLGVATATVAAFLGAGAPSRAADFEAVLARGELLWGGDLQGGEPYVFEDPDKPGQIRGFEVDIAAALSRQLGLRPHFVQTDWSSLVPGLERGDFDVILNGLEDTPERRERILLSSPYFVYGETLTVRKGSGYRNLAELHGKRVGTLNQTVAHDLLKAQPLEAVLYEGQEEPYFDLVNGRTEAVLLDHVIADRYGCNRPTLRCLPGDVARGTYVLGIARDHARLKQAIDSGLNALHTSGELERILRSWKLWDARQETAAPLASARLPPVASAAEVAPPRAEPPKTPALPPAKRRLSLGQLQLFAQGAAMTLLLSAASFALASPLGVLASILRLYSSKLGRTLATGYVEVFRGTPLLLQLYVLYFGISGIVKLSPVTAAILALGLNYGAYEAEVHRGALLAIPRAQTEAARALGLGRWQTLRYVLLPQSLKHALPAVTNDFVALLKDSSLVSVITVVELTKRMTIVAVELRDWVTPGLLCAGVYFLLSFPLAQLARRLERTLAHDQHPWPA